MGRRGLANFLNIFDDFGNGGEAANRNEVVARCAQVNPDVVLMDLVMPEVVLTLLVESWSS